MNNKILHALTLTLLLFLASCSKKSSTPEPKPISVKIAKSTSGDVPYYLSTVGHMEAYTTVDIMAQVNGYLVGTYFDNGAYVKKGDLLYLIDQRPYAANLQKAEASLEQNLANLKYAERTAERNSPLVKEDYISQEQFDNLVTNVLVDDALVRGNMADLETAKINFDYTTIYAPMEARAGATLVNNGNLVLESAETKLVTLNQIVPIYATFFISEKDLPKVQRYQSKQGPLTTILNVEDKEVAPYHGALTFIDNEVDRATGMVQMRATLPNEDHSLWPNQYVQITLILDTINDAILVPTETVQDSPKGKYVYVVKGNQTVDMRMVTTGQAQKNNLIVIEKGLKVGEKVVTDGQLNLYPGAKVSINKEDS